MENFSHQSQRLAHNGFRAVSHTQRNNFLNAPVTGIINFNKVSKMHQNVCFQGKNWTFSCASFQAGPVFHQEWRSKRPTNSPRPSDPPSEFGALWASAVLNLGKKDITTVQTSPNVDISRNSNGHISVLRDATVTRLGMLVVLHVLCMLV